METPRTIRNKATFSRRSALSSGAFATALALAASPITPGHVSPSASASSVSIPWRETERPNHSIPLSAAGPRGTASRQGVFPGPAPTPPLKVLWISDDFYASKLIATPDSVVWTNEYRVVSTGASTGLERWTVNIAKFVAAPVECDGIIYVASQEQGRGQVVAVESSSGEVVWRFERGIPLFVAASDGIVFVTGHNGSYQSPASTLITLDAKTGAAIWEFHGGDSLPTEAVVTDGSGGQAAVYFADRRGNVYASDVFGGHLWSFSAGDRPDWTAVAPIFADGRLFYGYGSQLSALDAVTGDEYWRFTAEGFRFGIPAYESETLLVALSAEDMDTDLLAIDATTGEERWRISGVGETPIIVDSILYFGGEEIVAVDIANGEEYWRFSETDDEYYNEMIVSYGMIYASSARGIVAIGEESAKLEAPSPGEGIFSGATVVVSSSGVKLRAAPSSVAMVHEELPIGTELVVVGPVEKVDDDSWWPVRNPLSDKSGFTLAREISLQSTAGAMTEVPVDSDLETEPQSQETAITVQVFANLGWQSTGLTVDRGDSLQIRVTSGEWSDGESEATPNPGIGESWLICAEMQAAELCLEPLPTFAKGALVGMVGGHVFAIGEGSTVSPEDSGELRLRINDEDAALENNFGVLTIEIYHR